MHRQPLLLVPIFLALLLAFAYRAPMVVAQPATPANLQWAPCDDVADTECAGLNVPVDPESAKSWGELRLQGAIQTTR